MFIKSLLPSNRLILRLPPSPPAFNLSQHQGRFKWVSSSHQVAKIMELQLQHQFFRCIFRVDFLWNWLVWSPCCPRDSQEPSPAPQFEGINSLALGVFIVQLSVKYYWEGTTEPSWEPVSKGIISYGGGGGGLVVKSRLTFATPWTVAHQFPLSMGKREYWSGLPFASQGDLPNPGIEPWSALQADSLPTELWGKPIISYVSV